MASKSQSQSKFLYPEEPREGPIQHKSSRTGRQTSVYDAVAGRISAAGFIPNQPVISSNRDTASSSATSISPEAALFRRKNAPTRFAEADIYFANERELQTELPESDLLKALHCYTSDFYSRTSKDQGLGDYRSMDGTALLALGILMEEAARDALGETGDLVFTAGEEVRAPSRKVRAGFTDSARIEPPRKRSRDKKRTKMGK